MSTVGSSLQRSVITGVIGGLIGGVVFGLLMGIWGMLPMVGMLIGQDNAVVGFIVHLLISATIGATFGVIAARLPGGWAAAVIGGGAYGIVWWVLGALILMPLMLGMNDMVLQIGEMQTNSLIGHIVFGVIMGAVYKAAADRM
jgi:uncharacterized membrane protein YagU involved in acid resistance